MVKGILVAIAAVLILGAAITSISDSGPTDTGYNQPPVGVQINVNAESGYVTVAVIGVNSANWLWSDGNDGEAVAGNWQPSNDCATGQGRYSGQLKFWQRTSATDYAKEPSVGQAVKHVVSWKSSCEPSGMSVQVFMQGQ